MQRRTSKRIPIRRSRCLPPNRRRGSSILLVIAILSLLVLLAVTLSFTSRLEIASATNFADRIQFQIAVLTGVDQASFSVQRSAPDGALGPLDLALNEEFARLRPGPSAEPSLALMLQDPARIPPARRAATDRQVNHPDLLQPLLVDGTAEIVLLDASSKINVNAAGQEVLARFFDAFAEGKGIDLNGEAIAEAIVSTRLGPDGQPGKKGVDDDLDGREAAELKPTQEEMMGAGGSRRVQSHTVVDLAKTARSTRTTVLPASQTPERTYSEEVLALLTGVDEPDEYVSDLRFPAFGDDVRFSSLGDLLRQPRIVEAGLTRDVLEAAQLYLTTFSVSEDERLVGLEPRPKLDVNRATVEEIYEGLVELYQGDGKNDVMLRQFALNLVDARDFDRIPTSFPGTGGAGLLIGVERTPYINEVYPDSLTPDAEGDDGQFVEIYNPWNESFDLTGWRIQGAGTSFTLQGPIAPNGYLILTDDLDNLADDPDRHAEGSGSLYDIFGVVPNGTSRRAMARLDFHLANGIATTQTISLFDERGNLVDVFTYQGFAQVDGFKSFQRENPLVRQTRVARATPFALPPRKAEPEIETLDRLRNYPQDGPFVNVADVMNVFAGFETSSLTEQVQWSFPALVSPSSPDPADQAASHDPYAIDARILDLFCIEYGVLSEAADEEAAPALGTDDPRSAAGRLDKEEAGSALRTRQARQVLSEEDFEAWSEHEYFGRPPGVRFGRINLNTAPGLILRSLPGIEEEQARELVTRREEKLRRARQGLLEDGLLFRRISDVLVDPDLYESDVSDQERLERFRALLPHITLNSRAFLLVGQPKVDTGSDIGVQQAMRIEALVALDRETPEVIYWRNLY